MYILLYIAYISSRVLPHTHTTTQKDLDDKIYYLLHYILEPLMYIYKIDTPYLHINTLCNMYSVSFFFLMRKTILINFYRILRYFLTINHFVSTFCRQ